MLARMALSVFVLLVAWPVVAVAQTGPVINQSTCSMTVDAPQTNVDGTNLTDLAGYRFYAAPDVASLAALTAPTFTVVAPSADPAAGASASTPCKTLATGAWVWAATAFDKAVPPNESVRTVAFPFVLRDDVSPSGPSNARMP